MASKGAQKGNQNAKKENRLWADAIRIAIVSGKKLRPLAEKLIAKAEEGDMAAMREIGDRLDGKPTQAISGPYGGDIPVSVGIRFVDANQR